VHLMTTPKTKQNCFLMRLEIFYIDEAFETIILDLKF
jgi:hypothetical protein